MFLGYAAGVGKTYQMLDEAQSAKAEGVDVVIGYFEPHGRKDTIAKTEGLEDNSPEKQFTIVEPPLRRWTQTPSWQGNRSYVS